MRELYANPCYCHREDCPDCALKKIVDRAIEDHKLVKTSKIPKSEYVDDRPLKKRWSRDQF